MGWSTLRQREAGILGSTQEQEIKIMNRDEMNTFFYLANRSQHDDSEYVYQPKVRSTDENKRLRLIAITSLILLTLLPFLVMTV